MKYSFHRGDEYICSPEQLSLSRENFPITSPRSKSNLLLIPDVPFSVGRFANFHGRLIEVCLSNFTCSNWILINSHLRLKMFLKVKFDSRVWKPSFKEVILCWKCDISINFNIKKSSESTRRHEFDLLLYVYVFLHSVRDMSNKYLAR